MDIRSYVPADFDDVVAFLRAEWAPHHAVYDRALFDWQYRIGTHPDASVVAVDGGRIVGFLGGVPGTWLLDGRPIPGVGLTMWCVAGPLRTSGVGIFLVRELERRFPLTYTLGAGRQVIPLYGRMGYDHVERLDRFVVPLDAQGYAALLDVPADDMAMLAIVAWTNEAREARCNAPLPASVGARGLERLVDLSAANRSTARLQLDRDAEHYRWRYLDSPGFRYEFLSTAAGIAVVRVESVRAAAIDVQSARVLRILEAWPEQGRAVSDLYGSVLRWASERGCAVADHQWAGSCAVVPPEAAGMRRQDGAAERGLVQLFAPHRRAIPPINAVWKCRGTPLRIEEVAFLKSDCDMDRPVFWPPPVEPSA